MSDVPITKRAATLSVESLRGLEWRQLHAADQARLREARLQAHYAVQWLARTARAYIRPELDDGHTSLSWEHSLEGFMTRPLSDGVRLSLQVPTLTLSLHEGDAKDDINSLSISGCQDETVREWLGDLLRARRLDPRVLDAQSPYKMPAHGIALGSVYDSVGSADTLAELAAWFANAESLLRQVRRQMMGSRLAASPVRCWPHHFDLATLTSLPIRSTDTIGYIGAGLSPGDEYYDEPYFYISVYPDPDSAKLPSLPRLGNWHTREFTAAIMPAHKLLTAQDQEVEAVDFLQAAVGSAIKLLS